MPNTLPRSQNIQSSNIQSANLGFGQEETVLQYDSSVDLSGEEEGLSDDNEDVGAEKKKGLMKKSIRKKRRTKIRVRREMYRLTLWNFMTAY